MDYGKRIKEAARTVHLELLNKKELNLIALQMKIKCEYGLGERAVNKHLEQLKKLKIISIDEEIITVVNEEGLRGLILQ